MSVQIRNTALRWGAVSQLFHWVIVGLILAQFALASIAEDLPAGVGKLATLARHKSVGITILGLAILRLVWKRFNKPSPPLPTDLKPYERILAHITHHGLYFLLFVLPLSGWMMSSAKNYPVSWFGIGSPLPNLVPVNETLFDVLKETHEILATLLLVTAALHVLGALQHHFIRKDDILRRMLPFTAKDTKHAALKVAVTAAVAVAVGIVAFRTLQPAQVPTAGSAVVATGESGAADSAAPAAAGGWTADVAGSTLGFSFVQAGATTAGSFGQYTANIDFKPAPAPGGSFDVRIETASVDTLDKERNEQLKTADLFDVAGHPQARYVATQFAAQGDGFEANGELTLRGVTKAVPLHFTYAASPDGKSATLKGTASIKRLEFGVGQGEWKSTEWVSDDVQVSFNLRLVPPAQ